VLQKAPKIKKMGKQIQKINIRTFISFIFTPTPTECSARKHGDEFVKTQRAKYLNAPGAVLWVWGLMSIFIMSFAWPALASLITPETVITLSNQERTAKNIPALQSSDKLTKAASDKAEDMISNNYFAHNSPNGITPWFWIEKNKYDYTYAGENLAMDFKTAEKEQRAWMESETHRKNILNPNYQEIGVAVRTGMLSGHLTTLVVQEFGARKDFIKIETPAPKIIQENPGSLPENVPVVLPGDLSSKVNISQPADAAGQVKALTRGLGQPFQYARENIGSPQFMDWLNLFSYSALVAIIFFINPLVMLWLVFRFALRRMKKIVPETEEAAAV